MRPTESPGLGFTHAKILRFWRGIPASPCKGKGVCDFAWFFHQEALGRVPWSGHCLCCWQGRALPCAPWFRSLAEGQRLLWRRAVFFCLFFFYSKNTAVILSAWIAIFIKNHQIHSAVGLGWLSSPARHTYCQRKGADESKQTVNAGFSFSSFPLLFFAGAFWQDGGYKSQRGPSQRPGLRRGGDPTAGGLPARPQLRAGRWLQGRPLTFFRPQTTRTVLRISSVHQSPPECPDCKEKIIHKYRCFLKE